ncbi:MAG: DUF2085 domain-containing protein [Calditrichaceae bacterium]|nr:DUF2085 domain-containing protein [Calditrichaceae bacterium]
MIRIITILLGLSLAAITTAPLLMQSGNLFLNYFGTVIYFLADPICHQLPERSLFINDLPMPVCARCFSIYLGGFFIFALAWIKQSCKQWPNWIYYAAVSLFSIEILLEHVNLYHNIIELRLLSGFILGLLLFRILLETIIKKRFI